MTNSDATITGEAVPVAVSTEPVVTEIVEPAPAPVVAPVMAEPAPAPVIAPVMAEPAPTFEYVPVEEEEGFYTALPDSY